MKTVFKAAKNPYTDSLTHKSDTKKAAWPAVVGRYPASASGDLIYTDICRHIR